MLVIPACGGKVVVDGFGAAQGATGSGGSSSSIDLDQETLVGYNGSSDSIRRQAIC